MLLMVYDILYHLSVSKQDELVFENQLFLLG
jgi:hypothetical protein